MQKPYIAVMQGRLLPPQEGRHQAFPRSDWRSEFPSAAAAGLSGIEWLFDVYGADFNPLGSDDGVTEMIALSRSTGVTVRSVCADYFKDRPFLRVSALERLALVDKMEWLLSRCSKAKIQRVVVPFLDESRIQNDSELRETASVIEVLLPSIEECRVELHLETSLEPRTYAVLLGLCEHPLLRVTYDSGNSSSLGFQVQDEFATYGNRVGSVHVKDRRRGAGTVPLGSGDTDLDAFFLELATINYTGDYVMEIARSTPGDETAWISKNRAWIEAKIAAARTMGKQ